MPHHYKKKQTGPISKKKKGGIKPKQQTKMGPGKPKEKPATRTQRKPQPPTKRKTVVKIEDRPGFFMKMGSKQKNTPSNFNESAFKMITGPGGSAGMGGMDPGSDFFKNIDPMNSLGQNTTDEMEQKYDEMNKAGYQPPLELVSKNTSGSPEAYASLGAGLRNLLKPKPGSQAEANQKYRKDAREAKRKAEGGTYVGNKLRDIFKTGKKNKNLNKYAKKPARKKGGSGGI